MEFRLIADITFKAINIDDAMAYVRDNFLREVPAWYIGQVDIFPADKEPYNEDSTTD